jgi:hypothetical protein
LAGLNWQAQPRLGADFVRGKQSERRDLSAEEGPGSMISVWAVLAIAIFGWIAVSVIAHPLRQFFKLREEVGSRMQELANVFTPAKDENEAPLHDAQEVLRHLGTRMSAFAGVRNRLLPLRRMGFDPSTASSSLIGLSNALHTPGMERLRWRAQIRHALKFQNTHGDARMKRSSLNPVLVIAALISIAVGTWMYTVNRSLRHDLMTAHIVRVAIEKGAKRTSERASEAEKAKVAANQLIAGARAELVEAQKAKTATELSLADMSEQLALTRKAKVGAELSLKQVKEQLATSETTRRTAEGQLNTLSNELATIKAAKDAAEGGLKAANDQLGQIKIAKEESDASAAKAKEDLERERAAREAAEQALHAAPTTPPTPSR